MGVPVKDYVAQSGIFATCALGLLGQAVEWWRARLDNLKSTVGIDSFKFDAGEANWMPASFSLNGGDDPGNWPAIFSTRYSESVAYFGTAIETRIGRRAQHLPIFVRMLDKVNKHTQALSHKEDSHSQNSNNYNTTFL